VAGVVGVGVAGVEVAVELDTVEDASSIFIFSSFNPGFFFFFWPALLAGGAVLVPDSVVVEEEDSVVAL
jgi:hypothetical protein